jgi:hypothetical protein
MRPFGTAVAALALLSVAACSDTADTTAEPVPTTTEPTPTTTAPTTTEPAMEPTTTTAPLDDRAQLRLRLGAELDDEALAETVVAGLSDETVAALVTLAGGDIAGSPMLSYTPTTVDPADIDSLWVFAYGYRFAPGVEPPADGAVPSPEQIDPGPVNEALAQLAAEFVAEHPMPIFTQVEVAVGLAERGVPYVVMIGPDIEPDGTIRYLSTAGVIEKGLRMADEAGITVGRTGVLCQADHAVRCLLTLRAQGLTADVPEGVVLPAEFDPESGQPWTRSREIWIPTDLAARTLFAG